MTMQMIKMDLFFPKDESKRACCADCLEENIIKHPGIENVRVDAPGLEHGDIENATIDLNYDSELVSMNQIEVLIEQAGACMQQTQANLVLPVVGMVSAERAMGAESVLNRLESVLAKASYETQTISVQFDRRYCTLPEVISQLDKLGIEIKPAEVSRDEDVNDARWIDKVGPGWLRAAVGEPELVMAFIGVVFLIAGALTGWLGGEDWHRVRVGLLVMSYAASGWYSFGEAYQAVRHFKFDIDVLMFAAAFGAASLGHYEEGALLLVLFALGGGGETLAMNRARSAIKSLAKLAPQTALKLLADGQQREVHVDDLVVGDHVFVRAGEAIASDGTVVDGQSSVDQSPITGESVPIDKRPGDGVYAGTLNGDGVITVRVTKLSSENTLAKVVKLVEQAQASKSPTEQFTAKVEKFYVPFVLAGTAGLIVVPPVLGITPVKQDGALWAGWFYQAMAFLTAASPCALAIGTPAAVLSGIGRAARVGVLIKGGVHLENLGRVKAIAFDKTGTLTTGRPVVTDVVTVGGVDGVAVDEQEMLEYAAAAERGSNHPLAKAIVLEAHARSCGGKQGSEIDQMPGFGIRATVEGKDVRIGRPAGMDDGLDGFEEAGGIVDGLSEQGKTIMLVAIDGRVAGVIALADKARGGAKAMVEEIRGLGIDHMIMLTGDNEKTAEAIAKVTGVDELEANLLPEDKMEVVRELEEKYGYVAMVGDGVNDAPAMANATVGIAMGGATGAGSDVALESADVALLADDLKMLPEAIGLSRFTRKIIGQNLLIALGVILVLSPMAAFGYTTIYGAVVFHEGSTVAVVINALRILGYKRKGG